MAIGAEVSTGFKQDLNRIKILKVKGFGHKNIRRSK
jgi:hypothetical protein